MRASRRRIDACQAVEQRLLLGCTQAIARLNSAEAGGLAGQHIAACGDIECAAIDMRELSSRLLHKQHAG